MFKRLNIYGLKSIERKKAIYGIFMIVFTMIAFFKTYAIAVQDNEKTI